MGELEDRLSSILNDPEQMRRISSLAQTLMGGGESSAQTGKAEGPREGGFPGSPGPLLSPPRGGGDKAALLEALKPWLSEKRQRKLTRAMRLAQMARLARFAMGNAGNGEAL